MNDCCKWHWALTDAIKQTRRAVRWQREKGTWDAALKLALFRAKNRRKGRDRPPVKTWSQALNRERRNNEHRTRSKWGKKLSNLSFNRKKHIEPKPRVIPDSQCPSCDREATTPDWTYRVLDQHKARVKRLCQSEWTKKLECIASGARRRPPAVIRTQSDKKPITSWRQGLRHAIQRAKSKAKWHAMPAWDRWCNNAATNNAKRKRFRVAKRERNSEQT